MYRVEIAFQRQPYTAGPARMLYYLETFDDALESLSEARSQYPDDPLIEVSITQESDCDEDKESPCDDNPEE